MSVSLMAKAYEDTSQAPLLQQCHDLTTKK